MKKLFFIVVSIIVITSLFASVSLKERVISEMIITLLKSWHFSPTDLDDNFSSKFYDLYLERMDYNKRFYLQSDIDKIEKYKYKLDDQLQAKNFTFYILADTLHDLRIMQVKKITHELLLEPFDYTLIEDLETDPKKYSFCTDNDDLINRWRKMLKFQTILKYLELVKNNQTPGDSLNTEEIDYLLDDDLIPEFEQKAREDINKRMENLFRRLSQRSEEEKFALYINTLTNIFDPHTTYMPPLENENFNMDMTGQFEGIGARLSEEDGLIKVTEIIPGSPSWRNKELEPEDTILKVAQGDETPVDIVEMPLREAVKFIRGKKGTEVRLTVRKPSREIKIISLIRDVIILEETYAKAAVIDDKDKSFGYIQLPKFYRDFSGKSNRNATDDVQKALENFGDIDGLILDLRNNGGGALPDAVGVAGLFIDEGPIVQVQGKQGKPRIDSDLDNKTYYDGPLIILINKLSASASEILAAALQDYQRAIIMGPEQSFGKGTVQSVVNLDRIFADRFNDMKPLGSFKITIQKFYRASGGSTQFEGVKSDLLLPDNYDYLEVGEQELDYALPWDTIDKSAYDLTQSVHGINQLQEALDKRLTNNDKFAKLEQRNQILKNRIENTLRHISINDVISENKHLKDQQDQVNVKFEENKAYQISKVEYFPVVNPDLNPEEINSNKWLSNLKKDITLEQAIEVLKEM